MLPHLFLRSRPSRQARKAGLLVDDAVAAPYLKLLSVGVLWMSVHCVGMCGPIVAGFDLSRGQRRLRDVALGVLRFQAGKAIVYASLGLIAGLAGAAMNHAWEQSASVVACAAGAVMVAVALRPAIERVVPKRKTSPTTSGPDLVQLTAPRRQTQSLGAKIRSTLVQMPAEGIGAALAFLPCMIPAWVLALAAATGSPVHGALLMLLLVVLNTPMLVVAQLFGSMAARVRGLAKGLQALSGLWLLLVGLAALDVVPHQSLGFELFGKQFMLMLF